MTMDRRDFLVAAGIAALAPMAAAAARRWGPAAAAAAPALRPASGGTSARLCARCGARDHATLDACCPEGGEARVARQSAARRKAGAAWRAGA
jgi:hypothetical protein